MKRTLLVLMIVCFVFSVLPVTAGPAYEKLKADKTYLLKVVRWNLPAFFFKPVILKAIGIMEDKGFLKTRFTNEMFDFILTKSEYVYSNLSFKNAARSKPFVLAIRLCLATKRLSYDEFMGLKNYFVQDLADNGFTRTDIKTVFDLLRQLREALGR